MTEAPADPTEDNEYALSFAPDQIFTIPNAITVGRMLATEKIGKLIEEDPAKWGPLAIAVGLTDNLDGMLARALDQETEIGRRLDPIADVYYSGRLAWAALRNGTLPKTIGGAMLAQKAFKAGVVGWGKINGVDIEVSQMGKLSEFATNVGASGFLVAEQIDDPEVKRKARKASAALAVAGITAGFLNAYGYYKEVKKKTQA